METIKTIIIDDETHAIDSLTALLVNFNEITILASFTDALSALDYLVTHSVDLIFSDIRMPQISGINFAHKLTDLDKDIPIIFTTAFSGHVLDALRNNAVDYLLKPVSPFELKEAIERAKKRISQHENGDSPDSNQTNHRRKLRFNTRTGFVTFFEDEILFIKADGVYSDIHLMNGKTIAVSQNLGKIEENLRLPHLIKVHRSVIVNFNHIFEIKRNTKQCLVIINDVRHELPVSHDGLKKIEALLK